MQKIEFKSLSFLVYPGVYLPAEDSFLLATYASAIVGGKRILDMGCGCGIAALAAAAADRNNIVIGADISPQAVACSRENAKNNSLANCSFFVSDLFSFLPKSSFDVALFNPPYLPTSASEKLKGAENFFYDGGKDGLRTIRKFVRGLNAFLAPKGKVAVVASSLSDGISKTKELLESKIGPAKIVSQESFFFEKIALLEATKHA
ncbi:MAG: methyltransferase [Candidatus Micrarchaeota archaeon]|nr:methyltransferase [Candidatus Micrarchaeota archaeon]